MLSGWGEGSRHVIVLLCLLFWKREVGRARSSCAGMQPLRTGQTGKMEAWKDTLPLVQRSGFSWFPLFKLIYGCLLTESYLHGRFQQECKNTGWFIVRKLPTSGAPDLNKGQRGGKIPLWENTLLLKSSFDVTSRKTGFKKNICYNLWLVGSDPACPSMPLFQAPLEFFYLKGGKAELSSAALWCVGLPWNLCKSGAGWHSPKVSKALAWELGLVYRGAQQLDVPEVANCIYIYAIA